MTTDTLVRHVALTVIATSPFIVASPPTTLSQTQLACDKEPSACLVDLYDVLQGLGSSRAEIAARFGPPDAQASTSRPNEHIDGTDSIIVWQYGATTFEFLKSGYDGRSFLLRTVMETPFRPELATFGFDEASASDIRAIYGRPHFTNRDGFGYWITRNGLDTDATLNFVFRGRGLFQIVAAPYVD